MQMCRHIGSLTRQNAFIPEHTNTFFQPVRSLALPHSLPPLHQTNSIPVRAGLLARLATPPFMTNMNASNQRKYGVLSVIYINIIINRARKSSATDAESRLCREDCMNGDFPLRAKYDHPSHFFAR